jgi:hypothetical protein
MTQLELSRDEVRVVEDALLAYISAFGHDEADILQHAQRVLEKVALTEARAEQDELGRAPA